MKLSLLLTASLIALAGVYAAPALAEQTAPCRYINPAKPSDNLSYGGGRRGFRPGDPGCIVKTAYFNRKKEGATTTIKWPDGVVTTIVIKTVGRQYYTETAYIELGSAAVDGEVANWVRPMGGDFSVCARIVANKRTVCF